MFTVPDATMPYRLSPSLPVLGTVRVAPAASLTPVDVVTVLPPRRAQASGRGAVGVRPRIRVR